MTSRITDTPVFSSSDGIVEHHANDRPEVFEIIMPRFLAALSCEMDLPLIDLIETLWLELGHNSSLFEKWMDVNQLLRTMEADEASMTDESIGHIARTFADDWRNSRT